ncbi:MAG: hypothetical protein J6A74_06060 [Oscillospiraceae bacterium]|nr:hypothetical protein [Oscillospiraceae bacterium]
MKNLRRSFDRFCYKNRDKGIPNLMLYIAIGNAIVLILSLFNGGAALYSLLCFDKSLILKGQVWRLVSYVFTQSSDSFLGLIFLYFFYMLGRHVEQSMGTFRFNLFYLSGVLLMDIFAMIFCPVIPDGGVTDAQYTMLITTLPVYYNMAYYLHLSLLLTFATLYPDARFLIFFVIPIKGWVIALIYLVMVAAEIFNLSVPVFYFPHNLFPLVAVANYLLFMGGGIRNVFPFLNRPRKMKTPKTTGTIPFVPKADPQPRDFTHRCRVCGRTDVTNPELEFRYCSRCNGYHCYCQDHINNHIHVE